MDEAVGTGTQAPTQVSRGGDALVRCVGKGGLARGDRRAPSSLLGSGFGVWPPQGPTAQSNQARLAVSSRLPYVSSPHPQPAHPPQAHGQHVTPLQPAAAGVCPSAAPKACPQPFPNPLPPPPILQDASNHPPTSITHPPTHTDPHHARRHIKRRGLAPPPPHSPLLQHDPGLPSPLPSRLLLLPPPQEAYPPERCCRRARAPTKGLCQKAEEEGTNTSSSSSSNKGGGGERRRRGGVAPRSLQGLPARAR